jgi:hypothetical protein
MNSRRRSTFRIFLPTLLALVLAVETIAVVSATGTPSPIADTAGVEAALRSTRDVVSPTVTRTVTRSAGEVGNPNVDPAEFIPVAPPLRVDPGAAASVRPQPAQKVPRVKSVAKSTGGAATTSSGPASYSGRNRMWMPALGINRSVSPFACRTSAYPGDRVYRWGCAGANNVYLFGHAHSVFKPLHDAYVGGRLKKGMKVVYADSNGKVRTYKIAWWKVTTPEKGDFAFAAQSRPSMTLQTCVGSKSQYRLVVRLVLAS